MIVLRKRLIIWLIKAYLKKWGKNIIFFFLIGLVFFFFFKFAFTFLISKMPVGQKESIGMVGAYTVNNIPPVILKEISYGLTIVSEDGKPIPGAAKNWKIQDDGKTYVFYLKNDVYFSDKTNLTSESLNYNFSDAKIIKPDKYVVVIQLKESHSPFLQTTVSKPIMKNNFIGIGEYKITDIKLNGNIIESLSLVSVKDRYKTKNYQFYPSQESLKIAFVLGEVSKAIGLQNTDYRNTSFNSFFNVKINKITNYNQLVTLFYNTQDPVLSDKKIRNGLSYALPDEFPFGEKAYTLFAPQSFTYSEQYMRLQDFSHSKLLISASDSSTKSAVLKLKLKTLSKYKKSAQIISESWEKVGVKTDIEVVDGIPSNFQIFLGDFHISKDPDQYTIWHSHQENNITNYKNLRIDKLLEDGRKITNIDQRKKIYLDFQKYLLDDSPASFLYYPYEFGIEKK